MFMFYCTFKNVCGIVIEYLEFFYLIMFGKMLEIKSKNNERKKYEYN